MATRPGSSGMAACPTDPDYNGYAVKYWYDEGGAAAWAIGRRTRMEVPGVTTSAWTYDLRGRVITESKTITNGGTFTTTYQYNALDQVTLITYPDGESVAQTYNPQGLGKTLNGTHTYVNAALYNALGQPRTLTLGNGLTTAYTYAATNFRLQRLWVGNLLDLNYTYDAVGNVTTLTDVTGNETQTFTYDALDRLIAAGTGSGGGAEVTPKNWTTC